MAGRKSPERYASLKAIVSPTNTRMRNVKPFLAWDGEGYSDDSGEHHYYLFGCSDGRYVSSPSLNTEECLDLLLATPRHAINVIFAGGYDAVMIFRKWPPDIVDRIIHGKATNYNGYRVELFKGKFLIVAKGGVSRTLYDVFSYFQTSFVKACREYLGNDDVLDRMEKTKAVRDSFTLDNLETEVIPYWKEELIYLVKLMETLRLRLHSVDVYPNKWHGPGAVSSTLLNSHGIGAHMKDQRDEIAEYARHAYYGGRFEQYKVGYGVGPIHQYDIRSAYPAAISQLRSLADSLWLRSEYPETPIDRFGLYRISYESNRLGAHPFPWRDTDGRIYYPPIVRNSWVWGIELQSAIDNCPEGDKITVHDGYEPLLGDEIFRWVPQMYEDRARLKANGDPAQLALKLCLNSLYGKLAQSKGARYRKGKWNLPRFHQLEWAGWITAYTRAKIFNAMMLAGNNLIAVETDAVYTTEPLPELTVSTALGDWEHEEYEAILYIQSGVYWKKGVGEEWVMKSRGFAPRGHTFDNWLDVMFQLPFDPTVTVSQTVRRFGTITGTDNFARWYDIERVATIIGGKTKRIHADRYCDACSMQLSFGQTLHDLIVPTWNIHLGQPSSPHPLPWAKKNDTPFDLGQFVNDEVIALQFPTLESQLERER